MLLGKGNGIDVALSPDDVETPAILQ